jgi:hypothetical protein
MLRKVHRPSSGWAGFSFQPEIKSMAAKSLCSCLSLPDLLCVDGNLDGIATIDMGVYELAYGLGPTSNMDGSTPE